MQRTTWVTLGLALAAAIVSLPVARAQNPALKPKPMAPGVLRVIDSLPEEGETVSGPRPVAEIQALKGDIEWTPNFLPAERTLLEEAKRATYRREIWHLEFAFKPLRLLYVDIPQPSGKMQRKLIWYLVYRVRNMGSHINPKEKVDESAAPVPDAEPNAPNMNRLVYTPERVDAPIRNFPRTFVPTFSLESPEQKVKYLDRVIPQAVLAIQRHEDPAIKLYNTAEISNVKIEVSDADASRPIWGVATWEDVDPRIHFLSIYVAGLTNSYRWVDEPGVFKKGDPLGTGRKFTHKTLQLNFHRAGDSELLHDQEITFGVPVSVNPELQNRFLGFYNVERPLDWLWIYR